MSAKRTLFFLIPLLLVNGIAQAQDKVYLPFFEALNLKQSYQYSITKLYKVYLEQTGRYEVILSGKRDSMALAEPIGQARESAEAMNTAYFIMGELNRVGEVVIISISLHTTADGKKVWSAIQKAESPEDLDPIMEKLAKVTGTNQDIRMEDDIYNVTDYNAKRLKTKRSVDNFGVSIGGAYPFISDEIDEEVAGGFGLVWSFDATNLIMDIKAEGYFNKVNKVFFMDIDVNYPFLDRPNTPFVMAGIGFGGMTVTREYEGEETLTGNTYTYESNESGGGMMGFLGGGYIFNRSSTVRLRLTAKGFYAVYDVIPDSNPSQPFGGIFSVAVLFAR